MMGAEVARAVLVVPGFLFVALVAVLAGRFLRWGQGAIWGLVGILGIVATIAVSIFLATTGSTSKADIEVVDFSVPRPVSVAATIEGGSAEHASGRASAEPLDITLRNTGVDAAVLTRAVLTVKSATALENCAQDGGSIVTSAVYDLTLTSTTSRIPFTVRHAMRFEVLGRRADRFVLKVGPKEFVEEEPPVLYQISLRLEGQGPSPLPHSLRVGDAVIVSMNAYSDDKPTDLKGNLFRSPPPEPADSSKGLVHDPYVAACQRRNRDAVNAFARLSRRQSSEFTVLRRAASGGPSNPTPTTTSQPQLGRPYLITAPMNIRSGPGTNFAQIGQVEAGATTFVTCTTIGETVDGPYGPTDNWDRIAYGSAQGFISDEYVDTKEDIKDRSLIPLC